ncbi:lysine--tRNA ligase [candidate division KSB1 bacterium]|nr:lysine--tRNA ligase [candidate division KSB1 bacterium]
MSLDDLNEILRQRRDKVADFRARGVEPYPYSFARDTPLADLLADFDAKLESAEGEGRKFAVAGRILTMRIMGKAAFCHLRDERGEMQIYVQRDRVGAEAYAIFKQLDLGDFVGFHGTAFRTRTNEPSLRAASFELLSKSLRPLPVVKEREGEVYDAFTDKEARYRQRYVDLAVNPEVRSIFRVRARIITAMRSFLDERGYLEVETPVLQPLYGGALAKPFTTFYNALDRNFFLRIADELYLKRLLVGGFERVYEISKDFRNEGMDRYHNPEFTMLEFYQAYADFNEIMDLAEALFRFVVRAAHSGPPPVSGGIEGGAESIPVTYQGQTIDFGKPFRRVRFYDLLTELTGQDLLGIELSQLVAIAKHHHIEVTKDMGEGKILDELMKTHVRPTLIEPTMIYDYPLSLSPLAKQHRDDPRLVERFQPFALGFELGNAFSELNDPLDQRARFEAQRALKEAGDEETQPVDEDFLRALEYGMPPTGGMGIGVDRLTMLLTDQTSIREVILFPQMRS